MLERALQFAALMLLFRSVPFVAYVLVSDRAGGAARLAAALSTVSTLLALELGGAPALETLGRGAALGVGFTGVALATHTLVGRVKLSGPIVLAAVLGAFLVLPSVVAPHTYRAEAATLGLELALAAHSFLVEARGSRRSLPDFLCFVLVNPVLVYPERGFELGGPALRGEGVLRILFGVATVTAQVTVGAWLLAPPGPKPPWLTVAVFSLTFYLAHSGLASLQIGLAVLVGLRVGERYRLPFLATSPADFWARWNVWLGSWARRHVYGPIRRVARRHLAPRGAAAVAVLATFAVVGLLHDGARLAAGGRPPDSMQRALGVTGLFLVLGLEVVGWSVLARGVRAARLRVPRARGVAGRVLGGLATTLLHVAHAGIAWRALAW